jgi:hypothetical protein
MVEEAIVPRENSEILPIKLSPLRQAKVCPNIYFIGERMMVNIDA